MRSVSRTSSITRWRRLSSTGPVKLEIVVSAGMVDQVVETIQKTAKTDKIGDGKIFVLDVGQAVRVRTGEVDEEAI